jgi:two-component system, NtrC family, response regulator AtoC
MMSTTPNILVVDDEPSMQRYLRTLLEVENYNVSTASTGEEAIDQVEKGLKPDLVLLDLLMPGIDGIQTLEKLRSMSPGLKVIMLSCVNDTRKVVQAMRMGARDFLPKPFQKTELDETIRQCLSISTPPVAKSTSVAGEVIELSDDKFFVYGSAAMRKIRSQAILVSNVDLPVLLLGESGTGKEVLAHFIHKTSPRGNRTFLKVNCAAMPADLLESELFGYEPGAFTGATRAKPGKFELCNKGTILLDEIGEMPPALQAKLLHVLQDGTFSRLGSRTSVKVDVRVLAATNINIQQAIADRKLREDLYYRLNGFTLTLPPLRDRKEEVPILMKHFMSRMAEKYARQALPFSPALMQACQSYNWPGNLRELENFVKRYLVLADEDMMIAEMVPKLSSGATGAASSGSITAESDAEGGLKKMVRGLKDEAEAEAIARTLEKTNWNRKQAAAELKISYKALLYKIRQYEIRQRSVV